MNSALDRYEPITRENVRPGDLVLRHSLGGLTIEPIEKIEDSRERPLYVTRYGSGPLDEAVVFTRNGRMLVGQKVLEISLKLYGNSK